MNYYCFYFLLSLALTHKQCEVTKTRSSSKQANSKIFNQLFLSVFKPLFIYLYLLYSCKCIYYLYLNLNLKTAYIKEQNDFCLLKFK